jgi:hypothetical protein
LFEGNAALFFAAKGGDPAKKKIVEEKNKARGYQYNYRRA